VGFPLWLVNRQPRYKSPEEYQHKHTTIISLRLSPYTIWTVRHTQAIWKTVSQCVQSRMQSPPALPLSLQLGGCIQGTSSAASNATPVPLYLSLSAPPEHTTSTSPAKVISKASLALAQEKDRTYFIDMSRLFATWLAPRTFLDTAWEAEPSC